MLPADWHIFPVRPVYPAEFEIRYVCNLVKFCRLYFSIVLFVVKVTDCFYSRPHTDGLAWLPLHVSAVCCRFCPVSDVKSAFSSMYGRWHAHSFCPRSCCLQKGLIIRSSFSYSLHYKFSVCVSVTPGREVNGHTASCQSGNAEVGEL